MSNWRAVTESGSIYESIDGHVRANGEYFHSVVMKNVMISRLDWDKIHALPEADLPRVGQRIYISTFGDAGWRISTPVVSLEVLD